MATFTFDLGFQRAILRLMQIDDGFAVKAVQHVEPGFFTSEALGWIFRFFAKHHATYNAIPGDLALTETVRKLSDQYRAGYEREADEIAKLAHVPDGEWVKAQLKDFCQQATFAQAHQESAQLFNAGKRDEAYDVMARAQERIQDIGFDHEERMWFFDELSDRQRQRWSEQLDSGKHVFSTGLPELDDICDGGVHRGELWAIFAYAKRCKTTWLINQGFNATLVHRRPTVHFLLEGRIDAIAARYDSCFSSELYSRVKRGDIDSSLYRDLQQRYQALRRLMVIRRLPGWDNDITHVLAELSYLRAKGFRPEMMVLDYMDLGRKRDPGRNESEMSHQVAFARDLKRLVENDNIAAWSAWQAQRPSKTAHVKQHVLYSGQVADAYAKVRIVSGYGSLNATDEEMARGEMRFFMEGHREAPVNKVWTITNDLARMRMVTSSVPYEPPSAAQASEEWAS